MLKTVYTLRINASTVKIIKNRVLFFYSTLSRNSQKSLYLCGFFALAKNDFLLYHIGMNDEMIKANIAKNISWYRKEKGMTQAELAKACGIKSANLCRLENGNGNLPVATLARIATGLGERVRD